MLRVGSEIIRALVVTHTQPFIVKDLILLGIWAWSRQYYIVDLGQRMVLKDLDWEINPSQLHLHPVKLGLTPAQIHFQV